MLLMTVEDREIKQECIEERRHPCASGLRRLGLRLMHSAGSPPLPLPDGNLDVLGSLIQMFLPSLSSTAILKLTVAPLVSSSLFPQPMHQACLLMLGS